MQMDTLMQFMQRILANGSRDKSAASLRQLREILQLQNADADMIGLVDRSLDSIHEAKGAARQAGFSESQLRVVLQRAEDARRREKELEDMGRC